MSARYRVEIARQALTSIQALPKKEQQRVRAATNSSPTPLDRQAVLP